jgi:rubrerythrin
MKKVECFRKISMVVLMIVVASMFLLPIKAQAAPTSPTLANLQTAFNGESNANAKYLAYAKKADEEGYYRVGRLFRAAARAEAIHAQNHAKVIRSMGTEPVAEIKLPQIKSTKANLEDAINGETYEQKEMYPEFLKQAAEDNNKEADQTFRYAREAEIEHARLYALALNDLEEWKVADRQFNVCPICGFTVEGKPSFADCPVCATPAEKYLSIS